MSTILLQDDFNDGVINTTKWEIVTPADNIQEETAVLIQRHRTRVDSLYLASYIQSIDTFSGDFEMDIDWVGVPSFLFYTTCAYSRLQARMIDGHIFEMGRLDRPCGDPWTRRHYYLARYFDGTTWVELGRLYRIVPSAKFRIKRTGSTIEGFYSEDGGTTWTLLGTKTGGSTANYKVRIETEGCIHRSEWDNFVLLGGQPVSVLVKKNRLTDEVLATYHL